MFILSEFKDIIRTPPNLFSQSIESCISQSLNQKLSNKVFPEVGLCLMLYDITNIEDSVIIPGDGASHTKVEFRYVVFRPFVSEIIIGKIRSCSKEGVHVTLGFFEDILIPPEGLQQPSRFDEKEQVWVWEFDNDGDKHDLFMDPGDKLKFRVISEQFTETSPISCPDIDGAPSTSEVDAPKIPYSLTASINEPGLGILSWWQGS